MHCFNKYIRFTGILFIINLLIIPVYTEEPPRFFGEEIVITASRMPQLKSELPASTTIITSTEIETFGANNLGDIIKLTFGTFPKTNGFLGSQVSGSIRGSSAQQILILIDGQRINSPLLGGYDLGDILADDIERIEIVRGPGSALYGADAFGGIINIISKKAKNKEKLNIVLAPTIFERGANNVLLSASGSKDGTDYGFSANSSGSPGFRENSDYTALKYSGDISRQFTNQFYSSLCFDVYNAKKGIPGSQTFPTPSTRQEDNNQQFRLLTQYKASDSWDLKVNSSFNNMEQSFSADPKLNPYDRYKSYSSMYELQNDIRIDPNNMLVVGGEYRNDQSKSTLCGTHLVTNKAYFLQDQLQLLNDLSLTASIRRDEYSIYGDTSSPRLGLTYKPVKGLSLWTSYGESYRAPTLNDLFSYYKDPVWGVVMRGNKSLKPERSNSSELGMNWLVFTNTQISANYFSTKVNDLIEWRDISGMFMLWEPRNIASANISGYELGVEHYLQSELKIFFNYSGLIPKDSSTGKDLVYRPRKQYNTGIQYNDKAGNSLGLFMRQVGARYDNADNARSVDAYTVVNLKYVVKVSPQAQLEFGAENFLNEEYQDTYDYPMPGRIYSFGFKYNLI